MAGESIHPPWVNPSPHRRGSHPHPPIAPPFPPGLSCTPHLPRAVHRVHLVRTMLRLVGPVGSVGHPFLGGATRRMVMGGPGIAGGGRIVRWCAWRIRCEGGRLRGEGGQTGRARASGLGCAHGVHDLGQHIRAKVLWPSGQRTALCVWGPLASRPMAHRPQVGGGCPGKVYWGAPQSQGDDKTGGLLGSTVA